MKRPSAGDLSGAVADLGVLVPLAAALILVNGLHPAPVLIMVGLLSLGAGGWFRIPFPVQPLKAMTALAVAQQLPGELIHAAGLLIGVVLVGLTLTGWADRLARAFTRPVIRSLQLAVGVLLMVAAYRLAVAPPPIFAAVPGAGWSLGLALSTAVAVGIAVWRRWYAAAGMVVVVGTSLAWIVGEPQFGSVALHMPSFALPSPALWATAFVVLVVPQLPLTYGNAVVGMSDLAREQFPAATRVVPGAVALSCGLGNIASALVGGMPMCHGSSGFSAHVRLGARTAAMNAVLGGTLVILGIVFSGQVLVVFGLLPVWALAGFLAYAGLRHAMLVLDLHGRARVLAVAAAAAGVTTRNLAWTTALALAVEWVPRWWSHARPDRSAATAGAGPSTYERS